MPAAEAGGLGPLASGGPEAVVPEEEFGGRTAALQAEPRGAAAAAAKAEEEEEALLAPGSQAADSLLHIGMASEGAAALPVAEA